MATAFKLAELGELSAAQRTRFARETRAYLRERDRLDIADRKRAIEAAVVRQREAMRKVVERCKANRCRVRKNIKRYRQEERERINREVAEMRAEARRVCELRKQAVRRAGGSVRSQKQAELEAERRLQAELGRAQRHAEKKQAKYARTAREALAESDDAVRQNIDAELVPVFDAVKRSIKGDAHRSRTEAFLQYVEENPGDVIALQQATADVEVKRLLAEQEKHEREAAKRRKHNYQPTKAELAEYLAEVPF